MTTAGNTNLIVTAGTLDGLDLPQWVASIVKEEWTNEVFDVELTRDEPNIGDELLNTLKWLCTVSIPHQLLG
ncbi:putative leucine-rich repeat receptor-like protein kinase IMK3 [Capsicum baccatum]|uniref:Leucine-rich repeat receptor-like protein kinase IMK3 n=1 Tax=Capsicum baccatum TaxID=33114 RepID=A0A2G2X6U2_CAPBA|nr:putative leucine-rich repeat receptor-like protein kinase IMK3 [Capsicum baccatum]